jgi:thioredoxin 1
MANEVTLTVDNFEAEVLKSKVPVLVDFWAEWCIPCKMIAPVLEEMSKELDGKIRIGKVDVDSQGELAQKYSVVSIPTLLLFKGGEMVKQHVGAAPKPALVKMVEPFLS